MRGLLDVHSRNTQNNTDTLADPIVTPFLLRNSPFSPSRRRRKRKMDDVISDSVLCETVSRVLGPPNPNRTTNSSPPCSSTDVDEASSSDMDASLPGQTQDYSNVILPWRRLLQFMSDNFCCQKCHRTFSIGNFEKIQVSFATSVNFFCPGCTAACLPAETREDLSRNDRNIRH
jgi:hypothetical protein